ncbi:MAG: glycosyltransferase family 2 protein [Gammaproteobacteria bacterium]|nr:glycosyltransferase family 2 protein [Gammaproteobacteria bacterium]
MSASFPSVSVIIATRNSANKVGWAIISVLEQSFSDFEAIIVNDASTDETAEVLEKFRRLDPRIIALTNDVCLGRAEARNVGIRYAHADLLAILDSDDLMLPTRLSRQVEFMRQYPSVGVLGSWAVYDLNSKLLLGTTPTGDAAIRHKLQNGSNAIINASSMIRKSLILSVGGYKSSKYSPTYNEDYYTFSCLLSKTQFAVLAEPLIVVCAQGLIKPERIKSKLIEMARLERNLFGNYPSIRRLIRLVMREAIVRSLPAWVLGALFYGRLRTWPEYSSPESISAWRNHIGQKWLEINAAKLN